MRTYFAEQKFKKLISGVSHVNWEMYSTSAYAIDCSNSLLRSENDTQQVVGIGLNDILAIAMPDAVLVGNKNRAKDMKMVVELSKEKNINQAEIFPKDRHSWGWFGRLISGERFQVKRILYKAWCSP